MKSVLTILISAISFSLLLTSCKKQDHDWIGQEPGHSILDLEYINDTLGLRLRDIRSVQMASDSFQIRVYVLPEADARFDGSYRFFLHLYEDQSREGDQSFLPVGTLDFERMNGALIYSRRFKSARSQFSKLRYGMIGPEGNRLFTLNVDTLKIEL